MPGWTITGQQQTTEPDASNRLIKGWRVHYRTTESNVDGSVFVPENEFTAARVKQILEGRVAHNDEIAKLKGE